MTAKQDKLNSKAKHLNAESPRTTQDEHQQTAGTVINGMQLAQLESLDTADGQVYRDLASETANHKAVDSQEAVEDSVGFNDFLSSPETLMLGEALEASEENLFYDEAEDPDLMQDEGSSFVLVQQLAGRGELTPGFATTTPLPDGRNEDVPMADDLLYREDATDPGTDPGPGPGPGPEPEPADYVERMVMYLDRDVLTRSDEEFEMAAHAQIDNHSPSCNCTDPSERGYGFSEFVDGQLVYQMTDETRQYLLENGGYLIDYITYEDEFGNEYRVQVILSVADENGNHAFDTDDSDYEHTVNGETHYSYTSNDEYDVRSSDGSDVMEFGKFTGVLETGRGSDEVQMTGTVTDATITLGANRNGVDTDGSDESNSLRIEDSVNDSRIYGTAGSEDIHITHTVDSGNASSGTAVSGTTVDTGEGADKVVVIAEAFGADTDVTGIDESTVNIGSDSTLDVSASGLSGDITGVSNSSITAGNDSEISILAESGYTDDVSGKGTVTAVNDTNISIGNNGTLDIDARSHNQDAVGVNVSAGESHSMVNGSGSNITITAETEAGTAVGLQSSGSSTIDLADGTTLSVSSTGTESSMGMSTAQNGSTTVKASNDNAINITASGSGTAEVNGIDSAGSTEIMAGENTGINLQVTGQNGASHGAQISGSLAIDGGTGSSLHVTGTAGVGPLHGINVLGGTSNISMDDVQFLLGGQGNVTGLEVREKGNSTISADSFALFVSQAATAKGIVVSGATNSVDANEVGIHIGFDESGNSTGQVNTGTLIETANDSISDGIQNITSENDINASITANRRANGIQTLLNANGSARTTLHAQNNVNLTVTSQNANTYGIDTNCNSSAGQAVTTVTAGGNISLATSANNDAIGTNAANGGHNSLTAGGNVIIDAASRAGSAYGVNVRANSTSDVTAGNGREISITTNAATNAQSVAVASGGNASFTATGGQFTASATAGTGNAHGIINTGGTTAVNTGDSSTVQVNAASTSGNAYAMSALASGTNTISQGNTASFTAQARSESGMAVTMQAEGNGSSNQVTLGNEATVSLMAATVSTAAYDVMNTANMLATGHGVNQISTGTDSNLEMTAEGSGETVNMQASLGGQNILDVGENSEITLTATSEGRRATAMNADGPFNGSLDVGQNIINAQGSTVNLNAYADTTNCDARGINANMGGINTVNADDVNIHAEGYNSYGITSAGNSGINNVTCNNLDLLSLAEYAAIGMETGNYGKLTVDFSDSLSVLADGATAQAYRVNSDGEGRLSGADHANINITAASGHGVAYGMHIIGTSTITAGDNAELTVSATSGYGQSFGISNDGGTSTVELGDDSSINVTAAGTTGSAYAIHANTGGINSFKQGDQSSLILDASSGSGTAHTLFADSSGSNEITLGESATLTFNAVSSAATTNADFLTATNMLAQAQGTNSITTGDNAVYTFTVSGADDVANMRAYSGTNTIETGINSQISMTVDSADRATCMDADSTNKSSPYDGMNVINTGEGSTVELNAFSEKGIARGINADNEGINIVTADTVNIHVQGKSAYGVTSYGGTGFNTINAKAVDIQAIGTSSGSGITGGMNGKTTINVSDSLNVFASGEQATAYVTATNGEAEINGVDGTVITMKAQSTTSNGLGMNIVALSTITAGDDAEFSLTAQTETGTCIGIQMGVTGPYIQPVNHITLGEHGMINIHSGSTSGSATAMDLANGESRISAGSNSDIAITSESNNGAWGIDASQSCDSIVSVGNDSSITLTATSHDSGAQAMTSSTGTVQNLLEGGNNSEIIVKAEGRQGAYGIYTWDGASPGQEGHASIKAGNESEITIEASSSDNAAYAMYNSGVIEINMGDSSSLNVSYDAGTDGAGIWGRGDYTISGGKNSDIVFDGKAGSAQAGGWLYGVYLTEGTGQISAGSLTMTLEGNDSNIGGFVLHKNASSTISLTGDLYLYAIHAAKAVGFSVTSGTQTVTSDGLIQIFFGVDESWESMYNVKNGIGIYTTNSDVDDGHQVFTANDMRVDTWCMDSAIGIHTFLGEKTTADVSTTINSATDFVINAYAPNGTADGIITDASNEKGTARTILNVNETLQIDVNGLNGATAASVYRGGYLEINAGEHAELTAVSDDGTAIGLLLSENASAVFNGDNSSALFISGSSGTDEEYGIYAEKNSDVTINGFNSVAIGGGEDGGTAIYLDNSTCSITYTENSKANYKFDGDIVVTNGGKNTISTAGGNDVIEIDGDIDGYRSGSSYGIEISTGDGRDTVTVEGSVNGSLIDLGADDDLLIIFGNITNSHLDGGDGMDTLMLYGSQSLSSLSTGSNVLHSFEVFDMRDEEGSSDTFTLDALLSNLGSLESLSASKFQGGDSLNLANENAIRIRGDDNDSVVLGNQWTDTGNTVTYDGVSYDVYRSSNNEFALIENQVNVI